MYGAVHLTLTCWNVEITFSNSMIIRMEKSIDVDDPKEINKHFNQSANNLQTNTNLRQNPQLK